jgi:hypothetical protein
MCLTDGLIANLSASVDNNMFLSSVFVLIVVLLSSKAPDDLNYHMYVHFSCEHESL